VGARVEKVSAPVEFDEPFKKPPTVGVALKRFDLGNRMANIPHRG
jgi:hypothetical protein